MRKINAANYVVMDVETNGLSAKKCDLLSISIYDPLKNIVYNRFLPLELNECVFTEEINGIDETMLENKLALTQEELDEIINSFDLEKRIILTYGDLDKRFIKKYCERHNLIGVEKLNFYNFKHQIISSSFSMQNIKKDNLCRLYNIENVKKVHSGENDCKLEWELFKSMNNKFLFVTGINVFELDNKYMIPVSYL